MKPVVSLLLVLSLLIVGCGDKQSSTGSSADNSPAAKVVVGVDVASLPDPCLLMPQAMAKELLQAEEVVQQNLGNQQIVSRMCSYKDTAEGSGKMAMMSLTMFSVTAMSSAVDSRSELVRKASELAGGLQPIVREDLGNLAFVFEQDSATRLQVLTGIGGVAEGGDEVASELQLGYAVNIPEMDGEKRQALLVDMAREHLAVLAAGVQ
jgi:hypothetical protein